MGGALRARRQKIARLDYMHRQGRISSGNVPLGLLVENPKKWTVKGTKNIVLSSGRKIAVPNYSLKRTKPETGRGKGGSGRKRGKHTGRRL